MKPSDADIPFRYSGYLIGINLLCLGINLNIRSDLGVAAFSTLPYTLSQVFTQFTFGEMNVIIYIILVSLQFLIERKMSLPLLLEIPFSFIFGLLVDLYGFILPPAGPSLPVRTSCAAGRQYTERYRCFPHGPGTAGGGAGGRYGGQYFQGIWPSLLPLQELL